MRQKKKTPALGGNRGAKHAFGKRLHYTTLKRRLKIRELARIAEGHQTADFEILHQDAIAEAEANHDRP